MSLDIVVLKLSEPLESLAELEEEPQAMGSIQSIQAAISQSFPGTKWQANTLGQWAHESSYSIEFLVPQQNEPESLQFVLHFGSAWSDETDADLTKRLTELYRSEGWQSSLPRTIPRFMSLIEVMRKPNKCIQPTYLPSLRCGKSAADAGRWAKLAVAHFLMLAIGASAS